MGDNNNIDPRPNTGPLKGNKPPQGTDTSTLTSPKSTGTRRLGADNRSRRSPTHSPTRSGRGRDKRYDEYTKSGNRGQSSTRSRSRHTKWHTVSRRKGTNHSAKQRSRDIEVDNSTRVPPNKGMPGHLAISAKMIQRFNTWSKTKKGEQPKTLTMGDIIEALRNGQIFDQFE